MTQWLMGLSLCVATLAVGMPTEARPNRHYSIKDPQTPVSILRMDPLHRIEIWQEKAAALVALLAFRTHTGPVPAVREPYNRAKHFGTWIPVDGCRNTRHLVLERDSESSVQWQGCKVLSGRWTDPLSGKGFRNPQEVDIDHFVALKNAYISGGWKWSQKTRCIYANFMGNNSHLKAVSRKENNLKSDLTPETYMPSDESYSCMYLKEWLYVKLIWQLKFTESEVDAIQDLVAEKNCAINDFQIPASEVIEQRDLIRNGQQYCNSL